MPTSSRAGRIAWPVWLSILAITAVALAARTLPHTERRGDSGLVRVEDPDAAYHLRRAERLRQGAPHLAARDPWLHPPEGASVIWPPIWDGLLAVATSLFPPEETSGRVPTAVAMLPPLTMVLAALLVAALARRSEPSLPGAALAAGLFAAGIAADGPWTGFGQLDHTAGELAGWALLALALARALAAPETRPRHAVLPGLALALGISVQAAFLVAAALPALALLALGRVALRSAATFLAALWGTAALALLPLAAPYALSGSPVAPTHFGLFQPWILSTAALLGAGLTLALAKTPTPRWHALRLGGGVLLAFAIASAALLAPELGAGLSFLGRRPEWIATIGESRSPFGGGLAAAMRAALHDYSWLALAAPLGLLRLWRTRSGPLRTEAPDSAGAAASVTLAWFALALALAATQARFAGHLLLPLAIAFGAAIAALFGRFAAGEGSAKARLAVAAAIVVLLGGTVASRLRATSVPDRAALALDRSWDVLQELRSRDAGADPPPVVVAEWSFGHFLAWYGRHPAAADNFGDVIGDLAFPRQVMLATDEADAIAAMERRGARYLFVGELAETFSGLLPSAADQQRFVESAGLAEGGRLEVRFKPAIVSTVLYRAARQLGSAVESPSEGFVPPLARFRLVAEGAASEAVSPGREVGLYKLFERVEGARLRLHGAPAGATVGLAAAIESPRGRRFPYLAVATADGDGVVEILFPYSTSGAATTRALELRWLLPVGDRAVVEIPEVSESAVRSGNLIELRLRP